MKVPNALEDLLMPPPNLDTIKENRVFNAR